MRDVVGIMAALLFGLAAGPESVVHASCDLIPQAQQSFRADLGTVNRPFASPGDVVELDVRPARCDGASPGLQPSATDHVVTLVFRPPGNGTPRAVVVAGDCSNPSVQASLGACGAQFPEGVTCRDPSHPTNPAGLVLVDRGGRSRLSFRFPDTDALFGPSGTDGRGLSGPVTIAVTAVGQPLPCALATQSCRTQTGVIACVDQLHDPDGTCDPTPHSVFPSFTALPRPNVYAANCFQDSPPCNAVDPLISLEIAVDGDGNLLIPFDWRGVLANEPGVAIPRLLQGAFKPALPITIPSTVFLRSFTPEGAALPPIFEPQVSDDVADPSIVTLFGSADAPASVLRVNLHRGRCQAAPSQECATSATCGIGDTCIPVCVGGAQNGNPCAEETEDVDCPAGRCGKLYDEAAFKAAVASGGAVDVLRLHSQQPIFDGLCQEGREVCTSDLSCDPLDPCVHYALEATLPVDLESLSGNSEEVLSLTARESVVGTSLNGDPDIQDLVLTVRDRRSGTVEELPVVDGFDGTGAPQADCGTTGDLGGRPIVQLYQPPFRFPAVETEGNVVAFLQSEYDEQYCDMNGDRDRHDAILRVFTLEGGDLLDGVEPRSIDPGLQVNERSLAVSSGRVFFRTSEAESGRRVTQGVSFAPGGGAGDTVGRIDVALSGDGTCTAFTSRSTDLLGPGGDTNGVADAFVRDRVSGALERVSLTAGGGETNGDAHEIAASGDCRFVVFSSAATNLPDGGATGIFLRDRCVAGGIPVPGCVPAIERIDVAAAGGAPNGAAARPRVSADGRYVIYESAATDLVPAATDTNARVDVFVRDRCLAGGTLVPACTPTTERLSVATGGAESDANSGVASVSDDGRRAVFASAAHTLGEANPSSYVHAYVRDRLAGTTTLVDVGSTGSAATGNASGPRISGNGKAVLYTSDANDIAAGEIYNVRDVFVRDLETGITDVISIDHLGVLADSETFGVDISRDGRRVLFATPENDILQFFGNNRSHVYVRDRLTGTTDAVSTISGLADLSTNAVTCPPATPSPLGGSVGMTMDGGRAIVFDPQTDTLRGIIPASTAYECAITRDGSTGYATANSGNSIRVFDLAADPPALASGTNPIPLPSTGMDLSLSPDGRYLAVCTSAGAVQVIDTATRTIIGTQTVSQTTCRAVEFCDDGDFLMLMATIFPNSTVGVYRRRIRPDGTIDSVTATSGSQVGSVNLLCASGTRAAVTVAGPAPRTNPIGFYQLPNIGTFQGWSFSPTIYSAALNRDGTRLWVRANGVLELRDVNATTGAMIGPLASVAAVGIPGHYGIDSVALDPTETKLYATLDGSQIDVLDAETLSPITAIDDPSMTPPIGFCMASGAVEQPSCAAMSADGQHYAFLSRDPLLYPPAGNPEGNSDVFIRETDSSDPLGVDDLLFADGSVDDTVLEVLDTTGPSPAITTLCPADEVVVSGGRALFLRPESAIGTAGCPGGSLNADGDTADLVVQLWPGSGAAQNQGLAATAVAMSDTWLAALVSETGQSDMLNADADADDDVVHVSPPGGGSWTNVGQAADAVKVCGPAVVFTTPEVDEGTSLNGDPDLDDRVLQLWNPATSTLVNTGQAVEDFVCGPTLVAFRTREAAQGDDLNGPDGDQADDVLALWDLTRPACLSASPPASCFIETHQAVRPCNLAACDPRRPYRVFERSVKFLTFECDQGGPETNGCAGGGTDLNADGSANDLILQTFEVTSLLPVPVAGILDSGESDPLGGDPDEIGTVFVATGRCLETTDTACDEDTDCAAGEFCDDATFCARDHRPCRVDDDCPAGITCEALQSTPASPDTDADGVPDHLDNCVDEPNTEQADLDDDGAGDACDRMTCGNGEREYTELCEPTGDTSWCGSNPCVSCLCECGNQGNPKNKVVIVAKRDQGKLVASFTLDLGTFTGSEPITLRLSDTDTPVIAEAGFEGLPASNNRLPTKTWQIKSKDPGVQMVKLTKSGRPGEYKLKLKTKQWFTAAAANRPAADTKFTLTIGTSCVSRTPLKKTD